MNLIFSLGDVKPKLSAKVYKLAFSLVFLLHILFLLISTSESAEIAGPEVRINNNEISVTTELSLNEKQVQELKNGITKEITFYIDLFRIWKMWPDEFVLGKSFIKTLKADPVKKEYVATSFDGSTIIEKRFNELDSLLKWALSIPELKLTNIRGLEPADYFVRITVESRIRKLPPVISYLFFFVPEKEFKKTKDSPAFRIGDTK